MVKNIKTFYITWCIRQKVPLIKYFREANIYENLSSSHVRSRPKTRIKTRLYVRLIPYFLEHETRLLVSTVSSLASILWTKLSYRAVSSFLLFSFLVFFFIPTLPCNFHTFQRCVSFLALKFVFLFIIISLVYNSSRARVERFMLIAVFIAVSSSRVSHALAGKQRYSIGKIWSGRSQRVRSVIIDSRCSYWF